MEFKVKFCGRRPRMITFNSYAQLVEYSKLFEYGNPHMPRTLWLEYIEGDIFALWQLSK